MAAPAPAKERLKERLSLEERIQRRAYELYVLRGNQSGSELDDWLQAEEEIRRAKEQPHQRKLNETRAFPARPAENRAGAGPRLPALNASARCRETF